MTAEACLDFCLGKGFDLFGVLSNLECRCGGSAGNEGAWQKQKPRRELLLSLNSMRACSGTDALKVYRYTGLFVAGSVPSMALHKHEQDFLYVDSVMAGRRILPHIMGDTARASINLGVGTKFEKVANASMLQREELRACAGGSQCGPGKPWPLRFKTPESSDLPWEEIVGITFHFAPGGDQDKKNDLRLATKHVMEHTCIRFLEQASGTQVHVETEIAQGGCGVSVLGYPGAGVTTKVKVGADSCKYGGMIHEMAHVLGLAHEHQRPDAARGVSGHGPYLTFKWDNIRAAYEEVVEKYGSSNLMNQMKTIEDSYVGSADDGPGDPYSGWAPYDFSSIMHYSTLSITMGKAKDCGSIIFAKSALRRSRSASETICHPATCSKSSTYTSASIEHNEEGRSHVCK